MQFNSPILNKSFGFQFGLKFDVNALACKEITSKPLTDFSKENYHFSNEKGQLRVSWFDIQFEINKSEKDALITIQFEALKDGSLSDFVSLEENFHSEAYHDLKSNEITTFNLAFINAIAVEDVVVWPNPIGEKIYLTVQSKNEGSGVFQITDVQGKIIFEKITELQKGVNQFEIMTDMFSESGMYIYQLKIKNNTFTGKLVKE